MITKALRYLLEKLEAREAKAAAAAARAGESLAPLVTHVVDEPPSTPPPPASCVVVNSSERDLTQIRSLMQEANAEVVVATSENLTNADVAKAANGVIFMGVAEGAEEAARATLAKLGAAHYGGAVQLLGANERVSMEALAEAAARESIRTLPSLVTPVTRNAIEETIKSEGLARTASGAIAVDLGVALRKHWIEFWYQPKIHLPTRRMVGAESLARLRHPTHGALLPGSFLPGAAVSDVAQLGIEALKTCFRDWVAFERAQFNLRLAVNIPIVAIDADEIVRLIDGQNLAKYWPGLVVDVEAKDIRDIKPETRELVKRLKERGVDIAVDNVNADPDALQSLVTLPVSEIKLARSLIHGVSNSASLQSICQLLIDLAHHLRATSVANGVETKPDLESLRGMGCDIVQGQVFAPALPRAQFVNLLMSRPRQGQPAG